jgi:ankyrin repeat protein
VNDQDFMSSVTTGDITAVRKALEQNPALARAKNNQGVSAILLAAYYRQSEVLKQLLAAPGPLDLFEAAAVGKTDRVHELIREKKASANDYASDGFTALGLAAFFGHMETAAALLAAGADVNAAARNPMKVAPLHAAAAARRTDIAQLLIEHGADVNARQQNDITPLHEAAAAGQIELARLLLARGAHVQAKTQDGKTPLDLAIERQQAQAADLLRQHRSA